jgi:hypothetical protein
MRELFPDRPFRIVEIDMKPTPEEIEERRAGHTRRAGDRVEVTRS